MIELEEMVSNKLVDSERPRKRRGVADKIGCDLKDFLKTRCYGDRDCQHCLNTSDAFCKPAYDSLYCDYKTKWEVFPMQKLPKFERESEMNRNDNLDLPSFNFSVDSE